MSCVGENTVKRMKLTDEYIINDSYLGKIKDVPVTPNCLKQFVDDVIYKHVNWGVLLPKLSEIYVLVACIHSQKYVNVNEGEKTWKEIMNQEQYELLEKNEKHIIAYMLIDEDDSSVHYITLFDTIVRNNNLGEHMINIYEKRNNYDICLLPKEIIITSAKYWAKILCVHNEKNIIQKYAIDNLISELNIKSTDLLWHDLYHYSGDTI